METVRLREEKVHTYAVPISICSEANRPLSGLTGKNEEKVGARKYEEISPTNTGKRGGSNFSNHETWNVSSASHKRRLTHLKIHALPVLIAVIGTRAIKGLISLA
jgi:hypothetical protein